MAKSMHSTKYMNVNERNLYSEGGAYVQENPGTKVKDTLPYHAQRQTMMNRPRNDKSSVIYVQLPNTSSCVFAAYEGEVLCFPRVSPENYSQGNKEADFNLGNPGETRHRNGERTSKPETTFHHENIQTGMPTYRPWLGGQNAHKIAYGLCPPTLPSGSGFQWPYRSMWTMLPASLHSQGGFNDGSEMAALNLSIRANFPSMRKTRNEATRNDAVYYMNSGVTNPEWRKDSHGKNCLYMHPNAPSYTTNHSPASVPYHPFHFVTMTPDVIYRKEATGVFPVLARV